MKSWRMVTVGGIAVVCLYLVVPAQAQEGTGERIGQKVDQAVGRLREEAKEVAGRVREGFEEVRSKVDRMGGEGRVYARVRWDKALQDAAITVNIGKDGHTVLSGTVPNEHARAKAVQLAKDTVGVEQVKDDLKIGPPLAR